MNTAIKRPLDGIRVTGPDGVEAVPKGKRPTRLRFVQEVKATDKYSKLVKGGKREAAAEEHVFFFDVTVPFPMERKLDLETKLEALRAEQDVLATAHTESLAEKDALVAYMLCL